MSVRAPHDQADPPVIHHRVQADGIELHVAEAGTPTGPVITWLHGSGPGASGLANFRHNLPTFAAFRNLVFDLPRYGESDRPAVEGPLVPFAAKQVVAALRNLGVERTHLIGNSYGGQISIRIAAEHPDLVGRVVSMGGSARPTEIGTYPTGLQQLFAYMSAPEPTREGMEEFVRAMVVDESLVTPELIDVRLAASRAAHPEIRLVPPNQGNLQEVLGDVRAPVLLLWGREDRFIPLEWALITLRGIADAQLVVLPRCGHWVQVEAKERFERIVLRFMTEER